MESGAREAKLLPDHRGIIVLTNDEQFFMVANFDEPRLVLVLATRRLHVHRRIPLTRETVGTMLVHFR